MGSLEVARTARGWAAKDGSGILTPFDVPLRDVSPDSVELKILFCGVCHTDLHQLRNDYGMSNYPMVAGHEVVGVVTQIGANVSKFKVGDKVGVGCLVGSCNQCGACSEDMEQYCAKRRWSYNDFYPDGQPTFGGFADTMVADEKFVVRIPEKVPLDQAAPLLCAGITVYSPMKHFGMTEPGKRCGILGLGGVGHMGVKFAKAFGQHVTVISTSPKKEEEARQVLGADDFLVSTDKAQMEAAAQSLDYILDTIPAPHPLDMYLPLLGMNGKLIVLGVVPAPLQFVAPNVILGRRMIAGSFIGSIKETQEMLELSAEKNIGCMIETITFDYINEAMERLDKNDVRYRFVVDVQKSFQQQQQQ